MRNRLFRVYVHSWLLYRRDRRTIIIYIYTIRAWMYRLCGARSGSPQLLLLYSVFPTRPQWCQGLYLYAVAWNLLSIRYDNYCSYMILHVHVHVHARSRWRLRLVTVCMWWTWTRRSWAKQRRGFRPVYREWQRRHSLRILRLAIWQTTLHCCNNRAISTSNMCMNKVSILSMFTCTV